MKGMVLSAGLGTRLRPLTNDRPKALVKIADRTLLEIALARLREFGVRDVIVNVHHFADMTSITPMRRRKSSAVRHLTTASFVPTNNSFWFRMRNTVLL